MRRAWCLQSVQPQLSLDNPCRKRPERDEQSSCLNSKAERQRRTEEQGECNFEGEIIFRTRSSEPMRTTFPAFLSGRPLCRPLRSDNISANSRGAPLGSGVNCF